MWGFRKFKISVQGRGMVQLGLEFFVFQWFLVFYQSFCDRCGVGKFFRCVVFIFQEVDISVIGLLCFKGLSKNLVLEFGFRFVEQLRFFWNLIVINFSYVQEFYYLIGGVLIVFQCQGKFQMVCVVQRVVLINFIKILYIFI